MGKEESYFNLVARRKNCGCCVGLTNPSIVDSGKYDSSHIGPWSRWQGNLDAEIMVVGQDWGDVEFFRKWQGIDPPRGNATNENLQMLLHEFGIHIGKPREAQPNVIFLTNLILCLKRGGLQAEVEEEWLQNCSRSFFRDLMSIIRPRKVLALSERVSKAILDCHGIPFRKSWGLPILMPKSPFRIGDNTLLFPVYHCGAGGVNRNRGFEDQREDWRRAADYK
jgi:uracil-DNA glycosylase